ncbi:MAG TPA: matrixin family metalloprotease [Candidatus Peribacteraceae bacterium]|nr:matrixin family metalloprotease [Candidatus Peribacteraceae bacterium]
MVICSILLVPLYVILLVLIPVISQIIQTVCSWVSSVIQVITTVVSKICQSLPWPLSVLCKWVTTVLTTLQTVWNWICNTVIQTIITIITQIVSFLIYITHIICIIINIIIGIPAFLLCLLRLNPPKKLRVCIKILTDENGNSAVTPAAIKANIARMMMAYRECNIEVIILGTEYIVKPEYLSSTDSSPSSICSAWHLWFTQRACWCCNQVTVFVVDQIIGAGGLTFWGDSWCRVDQDCNGDDSVMAHEVGHLLNLWHVNDPNNVMYPTYSPTSHNFTSFQCCLAKRSPFVTYL